MKLEKVLRNSMGIPFDSLIEIFNISFQMTVGMTSQ